MKTAEWVTPTEVPERALFLNWRTKEHKTPILFDMWSPSRNTLLMRDVSGDPEEMEMSEVEYLLEQTQPISITEIDEISDEQDALWNEVFNKTSKEVFDAGIKLTEKESLILDNFLDNLKMSGYRITKLSTPSVKEKTNWEREAKRRYPNSNKLAPHIHITPAIKKQARLKKAFIEGCNFGQMHSTDGLDKLIGMLETEISSISDTDNKDDRLARQAFKQVLTKAKEIKSKIV